MAEVDFLGTALAVFVPLTAALAILVLLPRWMRSRTSRQVRVRRKDRDEETDRTFNDLLSVQAMERDLRRDGRESPEAGERLREAWTAYEASEFERAEDLVGEARNILGKLEAPAVKEEPLPIVEVEALPDSKPVLGNEYPKNFLQARFMVSMLKESVGKGSSKKKKAARELLKDAEKAFDEEDYTEALSLALSGRKTLEGKEVAEKESEGSEDQTPRCSSCGEPVEPDDAFCAKCGTSLVVLPQCPECGQNVAEEDVFCRKCGHPLT